MQRALLSPCPSPPYPTLHSPPPSPTPLTASPLFSRGYLGRRSVRWMRQEINRTSSPPVPSLPAGHVTRGPIASTELPSRDVGERSQRKSKPRAGKEKLQVIHHGPFARHGVSPQLQQTAGRLKQRKRKKENCGCPRPRHTPPPVPWCPRRDLCLIDRH